MNMIVFFFIIDEKFGWSMANLMPAAAADDATADGGCGSGAA